MENPIGMDDDMCIQSAASLVGGLSITVRQGCALLHLNIQSIYLSIYLNLSESIYLSIYLSIDLSVYTYIHVYTFLCVSQDSSGFILFSFGHSPPRRDHHPIWCKDEANIGWGLPLVIIHL